jgi:hypothetical protein
MELGMAKTAMSLGLRDGHKVTKDMEKGISRRS